MLVDKTPAEIEVLDTLIAERTANGPTITQTTLQAALAADNASWKSPADWQLVTFSASALPVERRGKFMFVKARGATSRSAFTTITASGIVPFSEGDQITIKAQDGFLLDANLAGQPASVLMFADSHKVTYELIGSSWALVSSNPTIADLVVRTPERLAITSATLAMSGKVASVRYLTAETKATGNVTITVAGTSGSVTAYVDEGYTPFLLGTYSYTGSPTETAVAAGLVADIQARLAALEHEYDASNVLGVVSIIVPDGRGASANSYIISNITTGDCVATSDWFGVANGGTDGVDGAEANGSIEVINAGTADGTVITIINEMASNTIVLDSSSNPSTNLSSVKVIEAKDSATLIYSGTLGKWSIIASEQNGHCYGSYYMQGNATATTIGATNTFVKIAGTTTAGANVHNFTTATTNRLTYAGTTTKQFLVTFNAWFQSTNNDKCTFAVYKDGAIESPSKVYEFGSTRQLHVSGSYIVAMAPTSYIEIWCANGTTVANITVDQLMVSIIQI